MYPSCTNSLLPDRFICSEMAGDITCGSLLQKLQVRDWFVACAFAIRV